MMAAANDLDKPTGGGPVSPGRGNIVGMTYTNRNFVPAARYEYDFHGNLTAMDGPLAGAESGYCAPP